MRTLVLQLAPTCVERNHPSIMRDPPQWGDVPLERYQEPVSGTPIGRLVTMADVVGACRFLVENEAINGVNVAVDGVWLCT